MKAPTITVMKNNRIERDIRPTMPMVITLPVEVNGRDSGVALYVTASLFADPPVLPIGLKNIADEVSDRINKAPRRRSKKEEINGELLAACAMFTAAAHEVRDMLNSRGLACPASIALAAEKARNAIESARAVKS